MKEREIDDQLLDELLERPAMLRDHGFVEPLKSQLKSIEKIRKRVFLSAALSWMIISYLVLPVQFLTDSLQRISNMTLATESLIQSLMDLDLITFATQSGNLSILIILLLGAYALISLQVRRW